MISLPLSEQQRRVIAYSELWHFSKATRRQIIVRDDIEEGKFQVDISPPTALQTDFWKFFRDVSVVDPKIFSGPNWARYSYFFLGEPGRFQRMINIQKSALCIRIEGADFLSYTAGQSLFYRSVEKVVVLRGAYRGPAKVTSIP